MAFPVRRALWSLLPVTLLLACASGADETASVSSFGGSNPQPSSPAGSTSDAPPTGTTGRPDEGTTGRETSDFPEATGDTDPGPTGGLTGGPTGSTGALTGATSTGAGDESSSGEVVLCGNGMIDAPEECDGAELDAMDCTTLGFTGGALTCTPQCTFDKSQCTSPSCGDGTLDPGEECDCGQQGANCTAQQLGNAACTSLPSPNGGNYSAGALACNSPGSCSFNKAACVYCGDGVKNGPEACDGGDLGGQTCQSQGFASGNLSCASCAFSTAGCTTCGNGVVDGGEQCDGGNFNGQTCPSVDPGKFAGGNLVCNNCSQIGTGGCSSGNCCIVGGAGCQVPGIQNCVCSMDSFCCNNSWDNQCVNEAKSFCGAQCP